MLRCYAPFSMYKVSKICHKLLDIFIFFIYNMVCRWLNNIAEVIMTDAEIDAKVRDALQKVSGGNFTLNLIWEVCDGNYSREEYCCG